MSNSEQNSTDSFCPTPSEYQHPQQPERTIDPRHLGPTFNRLCTHGLKPHLLTGIIVDVLRWHFTNNSLIHDSDLRSLLWRDAKNTKILIEPHYRKTPQNVDMLPALIVKRNGIQASRYLIGNQMQIDELGRQTYGIMWVGSHTIFCRAALGAQVEILAAEVSRYLTELWPVLTATGFSLQSWKPVDIGAVGVLEEEKQGFVVPVTFGWAYEHTWMVEHEARKLRQVSLKDYIL